MLVRIFSKWHNQKQTAVENIFFFLFFSHSGQPWTRAVFKANMQGGKQSGLQQLNGNAENNVI